MTLPYYTQSSSVRLSFVLAMIKIDHIVYSLSARPELRKLFLFTDDYIHQIASKVAPARGLIMWACFGLVVVVARNVSPYQLVFINIINIISGLIEALRIVDYI